MKITEDSKANSAEALIEKLLADLEKKDSLIESHKRELQALKEQLTSPPELKVPNRSKVGVQKQKYVVKQGKKTTDQCISVDKKKEKDTKKSNKPEVVSKKYFQKTQVQNKNLQMYIYFSGY